MQEVRKSLWGMKMTSFYWEWAEARRNLTEKVIKIRNINRKATKEAIITSVRCKSMQ